MPAGTGVWVVKTKRSRALAPASAQAQQSRPWLDPALLEVSVKQNLPEGVVRLYLKPLAQGVPRLQARLRGLVGKAIDDFAMIAEAVERYWTHVESGELPRPD